jgi:hypothetical protein
MFTVNFMRENPKSIHQLMDTLPRLDKAPQYLWHCGYYDGPLSGVCMHNGKEHWFECTYETHWIDEDEEGESEYYQGRVFGLIELTDEEIRQEWERHKLFVKYGGMPLLEYDENNQRKCRRRDIINKFPGKQLYKLKMLLPWRKNWWKRYRKALEKRGLARDESGAEYRDRPMIAWYAKKFFSFDLCISEGLRKAGQL